MAIRLSPSEAARLGLPVAKPAKRGPNKTTKIPAALWAAYGIPEPVAEFRFSKRRFRFDYAWPDAKDANGMPAKLSLEIDGAAWTQGRHTRGKGFIADQVKGNIAICMGYRVLHCTPADVKSGAIFGTIKEALGIKT